MVCAGGGGVVIVPCAGGRVMIPTTYCNGNGRMSKSAAPDVLHLLLSEMETAVRRVIMAELEPIVRRAFSEGIRVGADGIRVAMNRAAAAALDEGAPVPMASRGVQPRVRMSPPRAGLATAPRRSEYGSLIAALRQALLLSGGVGINVPDMVQFCRERGIDVTPTAVRETIKQLRGNEEMIRVDRAYLPGPRLQGHAPAEERSPGQPRFDGLFRGDAEN